MLDIDLQQTRDRYRTRWQQCGYSPKSLGWDKGRQRVRFCAALELLAQDEYASVLDVGCGFGDLLGFLRERGWRGQYTGADIVPEFIEEARARYGGDAATFEVTDITGQAWTRQADMAVAIGIFNHRLVQDNMAFVGQMLDAMWVCTRRVVVLDFLSTSADYRRDDLFYADPREIYDLARRFSRRVAIHHAYMPFEFQVKIWRDDSFAVEAPTFSSYRALI